jgi:hypothetical protein
MKNSLTLRLAAAALVASTLLTLTSCNSTTIKDTWTAPDVSQIKFNKITVIAATKDGATRRIAEDALVATVTGIQCLPSYTLIPDGDSMKDLEKVSASLKAAAVDGVVVMRMISDKNEINVTQDMSYPMGYPMGYRSFGGYYGRYAMVGYNSTTVTTDRIIVIETNIYEMAGGKLIWSGVTSTTSPGNMKELADGASKAIRDQLVKQKLIPASAK